MSTPLADYIEERSAFEALLAAKCRKPILMFRGETGYGKTTLLSYCLENLPAGTTSIPVQLRGMTVNVAEIFSRAGEYLGWESLPNFTRRVAELEGTPKVQVDGNWLSGINNRINIVLRAKSPAARDDRRVALTEAWFGDMKAVQQIVLFVFDTYENSNSEVQEWISGPFLSRAARSSKVRILIAGQKLPSENNIEWGSYCVCHSLPGVINANHWLPVIEELKRSIPGGSDGLWLKGVCDALQGHPKNIMQVIKGLPVQESLV